MLNKGRQMFTRYRHTMHANTLDPKDYYWFAWSREEREAMELIAPRKALNHCNSMSIKCPSLSEKREYLPRNPRIKLHFGSRYDSFPYPEVEIEDTQITDPELRTKLLAWVVRDRQLCAWQSRFDSYAHALVWGSGRLKKADGEYLTINSVNTPGQLYRAWPEFASLVEKKYTDRMAAQKLRSAMPTGWSEETLEQFKHLPDMEEINQVLLTIAVMDNLENDRLYPDH